MKSLKKISFIHRVSWKKEKRNNKIKKMRAEVEAHNRKYPFNRIDDNSRFEIECHSKIEKKFKKKRKKR
jgi:uncharacterized protein YhbP (UPF0306 family)